MSKGKVIILVIIFVLLTNTGQGFVWMRRSANLETKLTTEIATLNSTIDAIGPATTVWTVSGEVQPGDIIKEESLTEMTMPLSMVNENYITNTMDAVDKFFKIGIKPGTALTKDMVMLDEIDDTTRDVDIYVDRWTVGLKVGDYVDCKLMLPYGDSYNVLSHKRIQSIGSGTLKVYLTSVEQHAYNGASVDYYLNVQKGATLYVDKYVEPGVQKPAQTYYAVPKNIEAIMLADPNIVNKAQDIINGSFRASIDKILEQLQSETNTVDTEAGLLNAGRAKFNSSVTADSSIFSEGTGDTDTAPDEEDVLSDVFVEDPVINPDGTTSTDTTAPADTTEEGGIVE